MSEARSCPCAEGERQVGPCLWVLLVHIDSGDRSSSGSSGSSSSGSRLLLI